MAKRHQRSNRELKKPKADKNKKKSVAPLPLFPAGKTQAGKTGR